MSPELDATQVVFSEVELVGLDSTQARVFAAAGAALSIVIELEHADVSELPALSVEVIRYV